MRPQTHRSPASPHRRARPGRRATARWLAGIAAALAALAASVAAGATAAQANTGSITANGPAVLATISSPNVPATFTFAGTSGEIVTVSTSGGTFANGCDVSLEILAPAGGTIASTGCAGTSTFIGETTLPGAATYTLELASSNGDTGSVTLSLSADPANGKITANGAAVTFTASHTGQGQSFTFTGKASEVVTLSASGGTFPGGCDMGMQILDPAGDILGSDGCAAVSAFIGETTLPVAGTYTVHVSPGGDDPGANTGSVTLSLSSNAAKSKIVVNGAAVTFTASHTGQGRDYTFTGTRGQVVTLSASGGTFPGGCDMGMQILDPAGDILGSDGCASVSAFIGETTLPGNGTYTVHVYPGGSDPGDSTGSVTLSLSADPASGTITANGAAVTFTATHTGQGKKFTFAGTVGEVVTLSASGGTFPGGCDVGMQILTPSGASLDSAGCSGVSSFIGETKLPGAGTYTVQVYPGNTDPGANTGSVTLSLSADPAGSTIAVNGPKVTFTASHTGQGQSFTFAGTASEVVGLTASSGTFPGGCDVGMEILSPSGSVVASNGCVGQGGAINSATLPGTGTYTVHVAPGGSDPGLNVGSLKLALT